MSTSARSTVELTDDPAKQHAWKRHKAGGDINLFAYRRSDIHNGPSCERCGQGFCEHCEPYCYRYVCPSAEAETK